MAPLMYFNSRQQVLLFYVLFFLFTSSVLLSASSDITDQQQQLGPKQQQFLGRIRRILDVGEADDGELKPKKKSSSATATNLSSKNQTKLLKPNLSNKNQTKTIKITTNTLSTKNQTKIASKSSNSTKTDKTELIKVKKLNSTFLPLKKLNTTSKSSNKTTSASTKKTLDLLKLEAPKNKTTKPTSPKQSQTPLAKKTNESQKNNNSPKAKTQTNNKQPSWLDQEDDADLVAEFRDLPSKFQQHLFPDLERISITSKKYLSKANKEMTRGFKPIVGNKYASTSASVVSFAFILVPLILVSLIFNQIKAYFSLQKVLIFIQVYLSIYFSILCLSALASGLEPLKFFYATAQSTYICLVVLQTLGYVLYLLVLLMYLVLVFSTDCEMGSKFLGLGQTFVGFAVGLHYYVAVFHRVVLHQPPKTNWKVHGIYAACFLVICLLARAERRKKAYLEEGGEEGKKN